MPRIRFDRMIIVQSIRVGEWPTGQQLFESMQAVARESGLAITVEFKSIATRFELENTLRTIYSETAATGRIPLIHLECHGNDEGLALSNGDFEYWDELSEILCSINRVANFDLFVSVSACFGAYLISRLSPTEPAPFSVCLSVSDRQYPDQLYQGFDAFYRTLFNTLNGDEALRALKAQNLRGAKFYLGEASEFFKLACSKYFERFCTPEKYKERVERILEEAAERGAPAKGFQEIFDFFTSTERSYFERFRTTYFMLDLFPDNAYRFPVEFEDVRAPRAT